MDMLRDLLLFLIIIAGGSYGLWLMRGLDGLVRRTGGSYGLWLMRGLDGLVRRKREESR